MFASRSILAAALLVGMAFPARAGFIITIPNAVVTPGQQTTLNVEIVSSGTDTLTAYSVEFQITRLHGNSNLQFVSPQPAFHYNDPTYVFTNNNSLDAALDPLSSPLANPFDGLGNGKLNTISGSDSAFSPITIVGNVLDPLLVTLTVQLDPNATATDQFQLDLLPGGTSFNNFDQDGNPLPPISYSFTPTLVTVNASSGPPMVPEPASLLLAGVGGGLLVLSRRRRTRGVSGR
jgi:hypothetical protein